MKAKYICFGHEIAPTTGTLHLQGYIQLKNRMSINQVQKLMPVGAHIEPVSGSDQPNYDYCSEETKDFFEIGQGLAVGYKTRYNCGFYVEGGYC